jgi:hypothetical protein
VQINENLSLVIPLRRDDEGKTLVHAYHVPISREVFEANFRILAATKAELFSKGRTYASDVGPDISALLLKDEARRDAFARGDLDKDGRPNAAGADALLAELRRLTTVLAPTAAGWEQIPLERAIASNVIDADDWREAEGGLVFFTCLYSMIPRRDRAKLAEGLAERLGGSATSLPLTEFAASLPTSTQIAGTTA